MKHRAALWQAGKVRRPRAAVYPHQVGHSKFPSTLVKGLSMNDLNLGSLTRRGFGGLVVRAGAVLGAAAAASAGDDFPPPRNPRGVDPRDPDHRDDGHAHDERGRDDHFLRVRELPCGLQHEFQRAISCNNVVARAEEVDFEGAQRGHRHAIVQRPANFGWGTITFFLGLDRRLVGQPMTFYTTVGWNGAAQGDVMFSVDINGDIIIDGARTAKNGWVPVERTIMVKSAELRVTLMVDSIRGDNNFTFYWGEPELRVARPQDRDHNHDHDEPRREDRRPLDRTPVRPPIDREPVDRDARPFRDQ